MSLHETARKIHFFTKNVVRNREAIEAKKNVEHPRREKVREKEKVKEKT